MNKTVIISIAVVVLALLGLGGYAVLSQKNNTPNTEVTSTTPGAEVANDSKSLKDLFSLTTSQQCTFDDKEGNSGTVIASSGKVKGDFVSTTAQGTLSSHMIVLDNTAYYWMDGQNTGFTMSFDDITKTEAQAQAEVKNLDLEKKVDYNCSAWSGAESTFAVPTNVKFTDFGKVTIPTGSGSFDSCSACDSLPDSAKDSCKAALSCE